MAQLKRKHKRSNRFNWHHRKCRSNGGTDDPSNLIQVSALLHECWHILFANREAVEIAEIINETWLDPEFYLVVYKKKDDYDE